MKKVLSLLLALVMVFCFASCGKKAETVEFKVSDLEGNVVYDFSVDYKDGATAGELLEEGLKANNISYEKYEDTMIDVIGNLAQDHTAWSQYWSFYLNGEYAQLGLWEQTVAAGDLVELKMETFAG